MGRDGTTPFMTRRDDRTLPNPYEYRRKWAKTLPLFVLAMVLSSLAIFNHQKSSSSVTNAILYALRTSEVGRRELGDEIYFRDKFPWIWGEMNQLHGKIDIRFAVKGTKSTGMVAFKSIRKKKRGFVSLGLFKKHQTSCPDFDF